MNMFMTTREQVLMLAYLGPIHQLDTEVSAILVEHGISVSQASQGFSESSLKEMPLDEPDRPWQPEEVDIYTPHANVSNLVLNID